MFLDSRFGEFERCVYELLKCNKIGETLRISKQFVGGGETLVSKDNLFCLGNPVSSKNVTCL